MPILQGKEAPTLYANGDKWNYQGSYSKERSSGMFFGQIPMLLRRYINNTLTGVNGNLLKLITLLIETDSSGTYKVSKKWVLEETGMAQDKYYKARQELEDMGWITCENDSIYINYDFLWEEALKPKEERIDVMSLRKR